MTGPSVFDHSVSPPRWTFPASYNAAHDFMERNRAAGRGGKLAYIDDTARVTYDELAVRVDRAAGALAGLGVPEESRVMVCLHDTIDYPAVFLGAIKAGLVPIATNTLLTTRDYAFMLGDSRARALVVAEDLLPKFAPLIGATPSLKHVVVAGADGHGHPRLDALMAAAPATFEAVPGSPDGIGYWLYTSGSTGSPKAAVHLQSHLMLTSELYARGVLGLDDGDVTFSAAKLFFTYGLGAALTFPLAVGATTVLMAERPTPASVFRRLVEHRPTVFYGVPTLFAAMLAADGPRRSDLALRFSVSAGEALSPDLCRRWRDRFGTEVLDGCGSTEMGHIYLSNRPGDVRDGASGKPVPGYAMKIVDEAGAPTPPGEIGDLYVAGPTSAIMYWNNRARTKDTFQGPWTRSGDKYTVDSDGYYVYAGRSDDMMKVSGQFVSPFEVEAALMSCPAVLEAAVVGIPDDNGLVKPKAFVVLKDPAGAGDAMAETLKQHVKALLAPFKYPRAIQFMAELPKTPTGKIQRFKLRQMGGG
ncbi:MAG: benzoate-CoA ligase family protein [Rhodospirillales bacterium]